MGLTGGKTCVGVIAGCACDNSDTCPNARGYADVGGIGLNTRAGFSSLASTCATISIGGMAPRNEEIVEGKETRSRSMPCGTTQRATRPYSVPFNVH